MRASALRALLFLLLAQVALGDYTFLGDYRSHQLEGHTLTIQSTNRDLRVRVFRGGTVQIVVGEEQSPPVELEQQVPQKVEFSATESALAVKFAEGSVEIKKQPLRVRIRRADGSEVTRDDPAFGHGWDGNEVRCWKVLDPSDRFYGLGEKSGDVNKRGSFFTNWNADTPAYRNDTDPLYCGIPFFTGISNGQAFGLFFNNTHRSTYNLGAGNRRLYSFGAEAGGMSYYVFLGPSPKEVLAQYTGVTGKMALPPKWALGYQQCRWSYYPEFEVRDVAREFRQRQIPADVLYFDIHYMDAYKVFTWHPERFPSPAKLLSDLKEQGYKAVTIIDPGIKIEDRYPVYEEGLQGDYFLKYLDGALFEGQVWPGWCHFPDFRKSTTRQWWGAHDAKLRSTGVAGFWNDMNAPALWGKEMPFVVEGIKALHNIYGLLMARATVEGLLADDPSQRPFVVTRAGWAGIQRYAAVWTGDNSASYDDLALSIRTNLGLGLSGVPFVGCDVGGFVGTPDPELYSRWMQAASLTPFMRSHTVADTPDQEPWSFGEETERRCKEAIERRYRLMPYLYALLHESHQTGLPMIRPLWMEFFEDSESFNSRYQHQFMVGPSLLVAPVIEKGQRFQKVYLPKGRWFEPATQKFHQGGASVLVEADLDTLPLFYREGAVIPNREVQQYVDEKPLELLTLTLVPGAPGRGRVVLDDGLTTSGESQVVEFEYDGKATLRARKPEGGRAGTLRRLRVQVAGGPVQESTFGSDLTLRVTGNKE